MLKILHDLDCRPSVGVTSGVAAMRLLAASEEREKQLKAKAEEEAKEQAEREAAAAVAKAKAEQEAREIKAKAEQAAKEQAEREAAAAVAKAKAEQAAKEQADREAAAAVAKAKAEQEAKEIKAKTEQVAKEQAEREAAAAAVAKAEKKSLANSLVWTEKRLGEQSRIPSNLTRLVSMQRTTTEAISRADSERESGKSLTEGEIRVKTNDFEGAYNPKDYTNLVVSADDYNNRSAHDMFEYITRYKSREIELETKLKCFMPEYIPAIGECDAFIKVPRPDKKDDEDCGYKYLDEPPNTMLTEEELEAYLAEVEREAARVVKGSQHVRIAGATGTNAGKVNGMYKPMEEMNDNVTVYAKVGDGDRWLVFNASYKQWNLQSTASKGTGSIFAYCKVPAKCLPQHSPVGRWKVAPGSQLQPAVTISVVTQEEADTYLAEVEREAGRPLKGTRCEVNYRGNVIPHTFYVGR